MHQPKRLTEEKGTASGKMTQKIKLIGFDFDSTLVCYRSATYSWELISKSLGSVKEQETMFKAYHNGEFDYLTWARKSVDMFKRYGLTRNRLEEIFYGEMELIQGVNELFVALKRKGIKSAVISGGIKNVYDIFTEKFGIAPDYVNMAHELKFDKKGKLVGESLSELDYDGKITVLQGLCDKCGISLSECAFVGDERNDIPVFKKVGLPIAINTLNPNVKAAAKVVIDKDISQILKYI